MSLEKGYVRIILFMLFSAISISLLKTYKSYTFYSDKKITSYYSSASTINNQLDNAFVYVENVSNALAADISKLDNTKDAKEISKILLRYKNIISKNSDLLSWTIFDFVDKNGAVIATSNGAIKKKTLVLKEGRQWMDLAPKQPWTGHLSNLDYGLVSGEYIIPYGYGFTNKNGEFIGTISMGISVKNLKSGLINTINNPDMKFLVYRKDKLNNKLEFIFSNIDESLITKKVNDKIAKFYNRSGNQKINLVTGGIEFKYLHKDTNSKFIVVVGQQEELIKNDLKSYIYPRIEQNVILVIFLLMIYIILKKKVINPILDLSKLSKKIADGGREVKIPRYECEEINYLARQIEKIKKYIGIEEIKEMAEKESISKTSFLTSVSNELRNSISIIYSISEIIGNKDGYDSLEEENKRYFLQEVRTQSKEALEFIVDVIDISQIESQDFKIGKLEDGDIEDLIRKSARIAGNADKSNLQITLDLEPNLPKITCDKRRIKQIFVNLFHKSIKYGKENIRISVKARKISSTSGRSISITIQDNGLGMANEDIKKALNQHKIEDYNSKEIDPLNLNLTIIKYLVTQHGGTFDIKSEIGRGTKFIIQL